jgi:hypothetical protein
MPNMTQHIKNNMSNEFLMLDLVGKDTLFAFLSHRVPEIFHFPDFKMAATAILKNTVSA